MKYLRRTIIVVVVLLVLNGGKFFFDKEYPRAQLFHHNLFSCIQFVLLVWLVFSLLLEITIFRRLAPAVAIKRSTLVFLVGLTLVEGLFVFYFTFPGQIPPGAAPSLRYYYDNFQRNIVQFDTAYSRYDTGLFYTLIPQKKFSFTNAEFSTGYTTNSKGLRDDEASLNKPPVIVLGDSYAMGWGVQQDETFAQQLEKMTGKTVLNTGISSYGTARELKNLYRLDTSALRYIIIQYCRNDDEENKSFIQHQYELKVSPEITYDSALQVQYWSKLYFPGKHFCTISKIYLATKLAELVKHVQKQNKPLVDHDIELKQGARYFMDILFNSHINFTKTKVLVIDMNEREAMNDQFINKADSLQQEPLYRQKFNANLVFIPVSKIFAKEDYYILDQHIRASGHKKLAELLKGYLSFP